MSRPPVATDPPATPVASETPNTAPQPPARRSRLWRAPALWALLGACLLAALYDRVGVTHLTTGVVGGGNDGYENLWNNWWVQWSLLDLHQSPFFTQYIYYPYGISLYYHTLNPFNGLLAIPFNLLLGSVPTINLLFLASLAATCFCAWLFLSDLVGNAAAAFVGAAVFTFANPLVEGFLTAGQAQKLAAEWLPLYFFALFRALNGRPVWAPGAATPLGYETRRWPRYAALAVLLLIITSLTDWQYVVYEVLTTVLYFAFVLLTRRSRQEKGHVFTRLAIIGGGYALIVVPTLLIPMIQEALANPWLNVGYQSALHSLDLLDLLGPGPSNPGYLVFALAILGFVVARGPAREAARFWAIMVGIFYLVALGPYLIVGGQSTPIPLPYLLIQELPVFNIGRDPGRFSSLAVLGLAVLVAFGLRWILDFRYWGLDSRWLARFHASRAGQPPSQGVIIPNPKPKIQNPLIMAAVLAISLGGWINTAGNVTAPPPDWPPFYEKIAQDPDTYALVELPLFTEKGRQEHFYQMYQSLHHKPRLGGHWARDHALTNPHNFVKTSSLFRQLWTLDLPNLRGLDFPALDFLQRTDYATQGLAILNYYNVRYIVIYKEAIDRDWDEAGFQRIIQQILGSGVQPYYEDAQMRVYYAPPGPPAANPLTLDTGDGWYQSEVRGDGKVFRLADNTNQQASQLYTMNLTHAPQAATLRFTVYAIQPRSVVVALNGAPLTTLTLDQPNNPRAISLDLTLPPGNNLIAFSTPEPPVPTGNPADNRLLTFGMYDVALQAK